jgi:formate transporter
MIGKVLSIWFPISTYVIVDFEHVLASMFFMVCGKFNGADYSWKDLLAYLVPATLGNFVGGALLIGGVLSSIPKNVLSAISH